MGIAAQQAQVFAMEGDFFERVVETSTYRLCRSLALVFAALYVVMVAVNGIAYRGLGPGLLGFIV